MEPRGTLSANPPAAYWRALSDHPDSAQVEALRRQVEDRLGEFIAEDLPGSPESAMRLLDRLAADGWVERTERHTCPSCEESLSREAADKEVCAECGEAFEPAGGVQIQVVYARSLPSARSLEWVVAVHGMNTRGDWQEEFNWLFGTTWGRSVPVAVYKYGIIIAGVLLPWRRRALKSALRRELWAKREKIRARGFTGKPDLVAHSFGTWLIGHLLRDELERKPEERLQFGRVILTGCILRPDFEWHQFKEIGLVDEVLNHYGTADAVVPMAHFTIWDSGPSGRRGFDSDQVINIRADRFGHSDLLTNKKFWVDGQPCHRAMEVGTSTEVESHLEHSYRTYWKPFLTRPSSELEQIPDRHDPPRRWREYPRLLQGVLFPLIALPLIAALLLLPLAGLGSLLGRLLAPLLVASGALATALSAILGWILSVRFWRR